MLIAVLSGFALALIAPSLHRLTHKRTGFLVGLLPLGLCVYFVRLASGLDADVAPVRETLAWVPSLGLSLSFTADGLSLLFAALISGIGFLVAIYSGGYLDNHPQLGRWYAYLLMFMASMLGVVLSSNLLAIFVFWELTSISSYLLIGFFHEEEDSRKAALQALLVTGLGGVAMLAGFVLLGRVGGSFEVHELAAGAGLIRGDPLYLPMLLLILAGAFTKSAQFPFHVWLPSAMAAPTPASAYLHSSTMVKAGIFLLARLFPVLGGTPAWTAVVMPVGAITMVFGAYVAMRQNILKKLLAYSTVSALGAMTMLLGMGTDGAVKAAVAFLFAHALYKAALFLAAGIIDHETGERDVRRLGGLARALPITAAGAAAAGLSMAGIPLLFGFVAKEIFYEAALHGPDGWAAALTTAAVVSSMFFVAAAACVAYRPFFGAATETPKRPHEAPASMWLGPALLGAGSLAFGVFPGWIGEGLLNHSASAALGKSVDLHLRLWHGFTPVLGLSAVTLLGGVAAYAVRPRFTAALATVHRGCDAIGPQRWYDGALNGMLVVAKLQTKVLQNGYLRHYLAVILITLVGLSGSVLLTHVKEIRKHVIDSLVIAWETVEFYELGLAVILIIAIAAAVHSRTRLAAIAALGVVGYGVALVFVLFGAPDLAMTQIVIETLTVILFVLVFYHLPPFAIYANRISRARDLLLATSVGVVMGVLTLVATATQAYPTISSYYGEMSYDLAHGRNVVNVILVDFRALDTMGEITVLTVAGVGAFALLKLRLGARSRGDEEGSS